MDEKVFTVSWESFVFIPLAFTGLSNKSRRTSKYFTQLFSRHFNNLSKIHATNFFLNLANALLLLTFRVAKVNFV